MRSLRRSLLFLVGIILFIPIIAVNADDDPDEPGVANDTCLQCHSDPNLSMPLEDGSLLSLYIDQETYDNSIHGELGYACVQCHRNLGEYPHPSFTAENRRDLALQLYTACQFCHSGQYALTLDSVHAHAREAGDPEAAICTDCHGAHNTQPLKDPETGELLPESRTRIPQTCAQCHSLIYEKYEDSVHGSALIGEGNPDVPTCIDCHGVHDIEDPTTASFRLNSPTICSECHTDPQRMSKYGISTEVLDTYVADFHGTTITLFEKLSPDAESNKPVCFDCHGVHDIKAVNDPDKGLQVRENLLARCQVCHPDATANFSDAWLSHYIPSQEKNSLVYFVNLFYKIFIPGTLGGMAILVILDIGSKVRARREEKVNAEKTTLDTPEDLIEPTNAKPTRSVLTLVKDARDEDIHHDLIQEQEPEEEVDENEPLLDSQEEPSQEVDDE